MIGNYRIVWSYVIAIFLIAGCKTSSYVADIDTSYERIDRYDKEDPELTALIAPYKTKLDKKMYEVIAYAPMDYTKGKPNSSLGSWFTDIMAKEAERLTGKEIAFAAQNYGGLRIPTMASGDITVSDIYELMPFDNMLVILDLSGATVQELLDMMASHGGWPVSDQLKFTISGGKATDVVIRDQPLMRDKRYLVALPDYIANGGDKAYYLVDQKRENLDLLIRDIIIDYLRDLPIDAKNQPTEFSARIK